MTLTVEQLFIHPVKSMAGFSVSAAMVTPDGLAGDRQFIVVSDKGKFRTARNFPSLLLITAHAREGFLTLSASSGTSVSSPIPIDATALQSVKVWGDEVTGADMGDEIARWLSDYLGKPSRLLAITQDSSRQGKFKGTPKGFADAAPMLLTTEASLGDLNGRLKLPVAQKNFRPNIVVGGAMEAFGEDLWAKIEISGVRMEVAWGCARCILTTVDPRTGDKSPDMEPIETLKTYRKAADKQIYFGQNIIPKQKGLIRVGDTVKIITTRSEPLYQVDGIA